MYLTKLFCRYIAILFLGCLFTPKAMAQRYAGFMDDFRNATTDSLMIVDGVRYFMLYVDYEDVHFVSLLNEYGERFPIGPAVPADTVFQDGYVYAQLGCETLCRPLGELKHDSLFVENEYPELFERCESTSPCNFRACDTNNFGCELLIDYPTGEGPGWDFMRQWIVNYVDTFTNFKPLTGEEKDFLEHMAIMYSQYPIVNCTNCKYCMPCPWGIDIPGIFKHYNTCINEGIFAGSRDESDYARNKRKYLTSYNKAIPTVRQADHCIFCRKCLPACPQSINIPRELKRIDDYIEKLKQDTL